MKFDPDDTDGDESQIQNLMQTCTFIEILYLQKFL